MLSVQPLLAAVLCFPLLSVPARARLPQEAGVENERGEEPELELLPGIFVTGTLESSGVPEVPLNATGSRDVLGPNEVKRIGAREINDLVQYLPALSTRPYNGGESSAPSFSNRGLPDDGLTEHILILIDGVPANPMPYGWTAFSFFPLIPEQVHAIDLHRGGHAVRYSPNTVGGVLNMITQPIPTEPSLRFDQSTGAYGHSSSVLRAGDTAGDFGYLVTLGERHGDGYRDGAEFDYGSVDLRTRWTWSEDDWFALRAGFVDNEHHPPGGLTQAQYAVDPLGNARPENVFRGHRFVMDAVRHVGDGEGFVECFGYLSRTRRNLRGNRPSFGAPMEHRIVDDDAYAAALGVRAQSTHDWLGIEHELFYGARVHQEWLPDRTTVSRPIPGGAETPLQEAEYELTSIAAHLDDTFSPTEDWELVLGLRAEWVPIAQGEDEVAGGRFEDRFFDLLPGVSTSYRITDELAAYANFQRSFRSPQVWGFDVSAGGSPQDLGFESGRSFEAGLRADLDAGLSGSLAAWHTEFDDVGIFGVNGYETIGNIEAEGADLVVRWEGGEAVDDLDGFSFYGSYSIQDSELVDATDPANDGNETPYAWEDKAAWSLQYESQSQWRFALGGVFVGESFSDDANTVAENANGNLGLNRSRTTWDAQIAKSFELGEALVELTLGATNVFDEEWFVHSRGGFFGGGKVAGAPRQVYGKVSVNL